jgi:hypothetical protein
MKTVGKIETSTQVMCRTMSIPPDYKHFPLTIKLQDVLWFKSMKDSVAENNRSAHISAVRDVNKEKRDHTSFNGITSAASEY